MNGMATTNLSLRWIELTVLALALFFINNNPARCACFAFGLILGSSANCLILWLQSLGFSTELIRLGLAYPNFDRLWAGRTMERYSGLHGHPNGAAAVIALCVPAMIALTIEFRKTLLLAVIAILICVPAALLTYSRSAFLVSLALLIFWFFRLRSSNRLIITGFTLVTAALIFFVAAPSLSERWAVDASSEGNAATRWETTQQSAEAILNSPFGLGSDFENGFSRDNQLSLSVLATHNAFTHLGLSGGLPIMILVLASLIAAASSLRTSNDLKAWLALYLLGIFFFEEHLRNPTFIVLTLWLVLAFLRNLLDNSAQRNHSRPHRDYRGLRQEQAIGSELQV
jgi:hypothetical protein